MNCIGLFKILFNYLDGPPSTSPPAVSLQTFIKETMSGLLYKMVETKLYLKAFLLKRYQPWK